MVIVWDGKKKDSRREVNIVDVRGWIEVGFHVCKESAEQQPEDVKWLLTEIIKSVKADESK